MSKHLAAAMALAMVLLPAAGSTPLLGTRNYFVGVLQEGDEDPSWEYPPAQVLGPPVCSAIVSFLHATLTLYALEGVAELEVYPLGGKVLTAVTSGTPPKAEAYYWYPSDCPKFVVRGLELPAPTVYDVYIESLT